MKKSILFLGLSLLIINISVAQTSLNAAGGDFVNESSSLSYSIGQVFYGTDIVYEGVQLPFNILEIVGIEDVKGIFLNISTFPNPTKDFLELRIDSEEFDYNNVIYQITDINGSVVISDKVLDFQTIVSMQNLASGVYFLEVKSKNNTVKTFKIVKN